MEFSTISVKFSKTGNDFVSPSSYLYKSGNSEKNQVHDDSRIPTFLSKRITQARGARKIKIRKLYSAGFLEVVKNGAEKDVSVGHRAGVNS